MDAIPPAARRKLIAGVRCDSEQGRDQRKAEQQKQRDGQRAAHIAIVTHTLAAIEDGALKLAKERLCAVETICLLRGKVSPGDTPRHFY
jgi:hypothetical protein